METTETLTYQSHLPRRQVIAALVGTMLSMFLGSIFMTITSTAMPRIVTDLGGFNQYTWVFTSYIITETISLPLAGKLSDIYGRKWFLVVGMSVFVIGSFLCGISHSMTELILYRAFQGIGFGIISALGFIVIADIFPPDERGKYGGFMAGVFGLSTVIGPTIGGYLTDALSWRWCFFVPIPIGVIIIIVFVALFPKIHPTAMKHKVDYGGAITMTLFVTPLILALNWGGVDYTWGSPIILGMFGFSVLMLVLFILIETRIEEPIVPIPLLKNRVVLISFIISFLMGGAFFPIVNFIPLYFQGVLGSSATVSGGFLTPMMLAAALGSFISGQLLSRAGGHFRLQAGIGFFITTIGLFLLSRMNPETSYVVAVINIIIIGLGNGLVMPIHMVAVQNTVDYSVMGAATSMITLLRPLGGVFGLALVGSILNNRFASDFLGSLSPEVSAYLSEEQLAGIVDNPQALVSIDAQKELQSLFDWAGTQGPALFEQMLLTLREALNTSLVQVFLIFLAVNVVALIINQLLKGIPPYGSQKRESPTTVRD